VRVPWKLRQQRGLQMVLAYVTNVLVKMNMFRTRCMLFYFAKTIEFVSWGNIFPFCLRLFLRAFQQPNPFCCNWSTTNLFMISFLSRTIYFFSFWAYGFICGWPRPVSSRSAKQPGWRSPPIVTIVTIEQTPGGVQAPAPHWKIPLLNSRWDVVCPCIHWMVQNTKQHLFLIHAREYSRLHNWDREQTHPARMRKDSTPGSSVVRNQRSENSSSSSSSSQRGICRCGWSQRVDG